MSRGIGSRIAALGILPVLAIALAAAGIWASVAEHGGPSIGEPSAADAAAAHYASQVDTFRTQVIAELAQNRGAHASQLRDILDRDIPTFPKLPSPAPEGAEKSEAYQAAVETSRSALLPFTNLRTQLNTAAQAETFVDGADDALNRATEALLRTSLVFDTKPLKKRTLPVLRDALADVQRLPVPEKGRPAAQAVIATLERAVDEVRTMIRKLDNGGRHSFDLSDEFANAHTKLRDYAVDVDGDVREAVARLHDSE